MFWTWANEFELVGGLVSPSPIEKYIHCKVMRLATSEDRGLGDSA